jgi:hypothetical protein
LFGGIEYGSRGGAGREVDYAGGGDVDIHGGGSGFDFYAFVLFPWGIKRRKSNEVKKRTKS